MGSPESPSGNANQNAIEKSPAKKPDPKLAQFAGKTALNGGKK